MLDLRIGKHLIDRIDGTARHAGFVETLDPIGAGTPCGQLVDFRIEGVAIFRSVWPGCVFRPGDQLRGLERMTETLPDLLAGGRDVDMALGGLEDARRNAGGVIVARLLRYLAFHEPARRLEIEHEYLSLQQRGLDLLTFVGLLPLQ